MYQFGTRAVTEDPTLEFTMVDSMLSGFHDVRDWVDFMAQHFIQLIEPRVNEVLATPFVLLM